MDSKNKNYSKIIINYFKSLTNKKKLSLHNPLIDKKEITYVKSCIDTTFISNKSFFVNKFENKLKKLLSQNI